MSTGLTKREWFAGQVLIGIFTQPGWQTYDWNACSKAASDIAKCMCNIVDCMFDAPAFPQPDPSAAKSILLTEMDRIIGKGRSPRHEHE